ncbi:MAG: sigma factor-like helix-turn-helix DNA-binding protein [Candidatus Falkowbacteria bacterium]
MNEESLLNQIMSKNKEDELASLNIADFVNRLFSGLNKREQEVLLSRFGLGGFPKETLEAIGKKHQLTRERIRQIETTSIAKLKKLGVADQVLARLGQAISEILEEHAGTIDKDYLKEILFELSHGRENLGREAHDRYVDFVTAKLLDSHFEEVKNSDHFNSFLKLKFREVDHMEQVAEELLAKVREMKTLLNTEDLIAMAKGLDAYKQNQDKFKAPGNLNLRLPLEKVIDGFSDGIYENRSVYNMLRSLSDLQQNKFKQWGASDWREVNPKTINDKIYMVLKSDGKPMYYGDIAKRIAEMGFDAKGVNVATTHNELILDDKYILVGRGLYGLREWGYQSGTVADIIASILEKQSPLTKEDIIKNVLQQRIVKQTTINLALMNKNRFRKLDGGVYEPVV